MNSATMKALVYEGPKTMRMRRVPVPEPKPDEVRIRVTIAGICGSELSGYLGHNSLRVPPLIMGHEFSGIVDKAGSEVRSMRVGDRVTANPLISCGRCRSCVAGAANLCIRRQLIGAHLPGAFAEYVTVPEHNVFTIMDSMSDDQAAMTEPFACAVHICRLVQLSAVDRLLIAGGGPIGLFVLQAAKQFGVDHITVMDINRDRLDIADALGAKTVTNDTKLPKDKKFDVAVDAVGLDVTRQQCIHSVGLGGKVVFSGLHSADSQIPANLLVRNEVRIFGAFGYQPHDFQIALEWLSSDKAGLTNWTMHAPLEKGGECFKLLLDGPGKVAKVLLSLA